MDEENRDILRSRFRWKGKMEDVRVLPADHLVVLMFARRRPFSKDTVRKSKSSEVEDGISASRRQYQGYLLVGEFSLRFGTFVP